MTTVFPIKQRSRDFWRVNSYGYPNFFSNGKNAKIAWSTFLSFFDFSDYDELKIHWDKPGPRKLSSTAVESWKAAFEEFGLLYVESGSKKIRITPAGAQFRAAAEAQDEAAFAWIGLNLLLRYPLRGVRRPKSAENGASDILLYRCFYSALLDLDNYIWWTEIERILCRVFRSADVADAVTDIRTLRADPALIAKLDAPEDNDTLNFYNLLNQLTVHAGMNYLLLDMETPACPYGVTERKRKHAIRPEWLGMIRQALNQPDGTNQCSTGGSAVARLPSAPVFNSEAAYFEYLGAEVAPLAQAVPSALPAISVHGDMVFFLTQNVDYRPDSAPLTIHGLTTSLCQLAVGHRLILSHEKSWTYKVQGKELLDATTVRVRLQRARPISDFDAAFAAFGR